MVMPVPPRNKSPLNKIGQVSRNLRGDDADSQSPAPKTTLEPTGRSDKEREAQQTRAHRQAGPGQNAVRKGIF